MVNQIVNNVGDSGGIDFYERLVASQTRVLNDISKFCEVSERSIYSGSWLHPPTSTTKLTHSIRLALSPPPCSIKNAPRFARRRRRT